MTTLRRATYQFGRRLINRLQLHIIYLSWWKLHSRRGKYFDWKWTFKKKKREIDILEIFGENVESISCGIFMNWVMPKRITWIFFGLKTFSYVFLSKLYIGFEVGVLEEKTDFARNLVNIISRIVAQWTSIHRFWFIFFYVLIFNFNMLFYKFLIFLTHIMSTYEWPTYIVNTSITDQVYNIYKKSIIYRSIIWCINIVYVIKK